MISEDILKAAKEYTERGWPVHPLSRPDDTGTSPGKRPITPAWEQLKKTPENIGSDIKKGCNIGLVCGAASGIDAIDIDNDIFMSELLDGVEIDTLTSGHRTGRGHLLIKHDETMIGEKHHFIGIEYFGTSAKGGGSNLVLPPSVHHSGEVYKWKNPETPIAELPGKLKENMLALFKKEDALHDYFKKCRHCFTKGSRKYDKTEDIRKKGLWDRPDDIAVHGMDGRLAILAIMGELRAQGCTNELMHMACKRFFGKDYDYNLTENELGHIEPIHPKCETLRQYLNVECDGCSWKPTENKSNENSNGDTCADCTYKPHGAAGFCKHKDHRKGEKDQKYRNVTDSACSEFIKKIQIILRSPDGGIRVFDIPAEKIDPQPLTIQDLIEEYRKNLYVEEDINISLPLAFTISNHSHCDPDALGIIGPSGSGKTEVVRSLGDTENQYVYPISSLTARTFVSGYKDAQDLAPQLQKRLITIKDFTSILSKNKDEVSGIFADIRDILDGYIQKVYGSEVGKKEFKDIHSSFLFACTNAIEKYYSVYSVLGQRLVFFRPLNNARLARLKAMENAGKEKEIREKHHALTMRVINTALTTQKDRIENLTKNVPMDMQERIGKLCEFLAIVRTHIDRDIKGDMASLPEPELPTRLTKTLCKIVDAHSVLYNRMPTIEDEVTAVRLIYDNIPTERVTILKALCAYDKAEKTSTIAIAANVPTAMCSRVLNDLAALGLVTRWDKYDLKSNSDEWRIIDDIDNDEQQYRKCFLLISNYKYWPVVSEMLRGVIRDGIYVEHIESLNRFKEYINKDSNIINKEKTNEVFNIIYSYLSDSHPSTFQEPEPEEKKDEPIKINIYENYQDPFKKAQIKDYILTTYPNGDRPSKEGWDMVMSWIMGTPLNLHMSTAREYLIEVRKELGVGW